MGKLTKRGASSSPRPSSSHSGSSLHRFGEKVSRHFGGERHPAAEPYLSYYDVRLDYGDVSTIKSGWLTDAVIAFWEEYLEREKLSKYPKANIVLLRPTMTTLLLRTQEKFFRGLESALPDFSKTTHIFLPVNDSRGDEAEGGSHWSLLLVSNIDGVAFHYDSLGCNIDEARMVSQRFSRLLKRDLRFINLDDTPQQANGSDCGVYVCLLMQHLLLQRLLRTHANDKVSMSLRGKEVDARGGRDEILRVVRERRREGERRRSRSQSPYPSQHSKPSPPRIGAENE